MKPAEIVTAVVSIPVVAAFVVSALAAPAEPPAPVAPRTELSQAAAPLNVADEIVIVAKRAAASRAG
jgi:hypothetical protein